MNGCVPAAEGGRQIVGVLANKVIIVIIIE
jgi:hypothetical protein